MHPSEPFPHFVEDVLAFFHEALPARATLDGVHLHDDLLEDLSRQGVDSHARTLAGFSRRLEQIDRKALSEPEQVDHRILAAALEGLIFDIERVRAWERSPLIYAETLGAGLAGPTYLAYAPEADRARRLVSRLRQVPRLAKSCTDNVREPAAIVVKLGLEAWRGVRTFLERDLPRGFARLDDLHVLGDLADASQEATEAVSACIDHFEREVAPKARASFRLGADVVEHSIRSVEGINASSERAMELGLRWLSEAQEEFRQTAASIEKGEPSEVWRSIKTRLLSARGPLDGARETLDELGGYLNKQTVVGMPDGELPLLAPAPEFNRWQQATLWAAGPFEPKPTRPRLTLALGDVSWPEDRKREHALDLNQATRRVLLAREANPGRLTLVNTLRAIESKTRKATFFASRSFRDGWSLYAQRALLDSGYHRNEPELRLAQIAETLVALSRLVVAIRLHADDMSVEQGVRFFKDEAYLEESTARREAERGVFDPGYMFQALGHRLLLRLRHDFSEQHSTSPSHRAFHDALLGQGAAPIWAHRRLLLKDQETVTLD
ncbi:MAG: DUF885 domain-containing protein [SAR202 cluster bacterium]|nr:DUF885 domain-containing protein [SAR202 cluster bacterium]